MNYPNQLDILSTDSIFEFLDDHYLRQDPYAFKNDDFRKFVRDCVKRLGVDPNAIYCIGSGATGLSLNPKKIKHGKLKAFDNHSDLDIAIISETHFETAWRDLREKDHPVVAELDDELQRLMRWQRSRFFDGAILASKILPGLSFGNEWITSLEGVKSTASILIGRPVEVNIWIYRDYWSMRSYVAKSLDRCRKETKR
ncbi:MAG: hypothetical protein WAS05_05570 [Candidatus Nanopelagicales bacterium]